MKSCKIIDISDLHLGVARLSPTTLHDNLIEYLYPKLTEELFMLIINGDFFDSQLTMNSESGLMAGIIIDEILALCKQNKIYLRVLRGTYSHDRKQNQWFLVRDKGKVTLNEIPLVRVLTELEWEAIPFNNTSVSFLYVPDNLPYTDWTESILNALDSSHIKKVDFIVSHCYYEHHIPKGLQTPPSNLVYQDRLATYLNGCILNGHIHSTSICKKVVTIGSFERFGHGEEEEKGFYEIDYEPTTHKCKLDFVSNKHTSIFHTIDLVGVDTYEHALQVINNKLSSLPIKESTKHGESVYIRLISDNIEMRHALELYLKNEYHNFVITSKSVKSQNITEEIMLPTDCDLPTITPENLPAMIQKNCTLPLSETQIQEVLNGTI